MHQGLVAAREVLLQELSLREEQVLELELELEMIIRLPGDYEIKRVKGLFINVWQHEV